MLNSLAEGITLRYIRQVKHARRPTLCVRPYGNPRYSSHLANIYAIPYTLSRSLSKSPPSDQGLSNNPKALKSPRRLGLFRKWLAPPSQQWRRAARPATNALTRKGGPMPASLSIPSPALEGGPLPHFCKGSPPPVCSASLTVVAQRAWRNGRRSGLEENLSARPETGDAELPKFGEPSHMAIPSQARSQPNREGVETRRAAPNPGFHPGHGEGIVQTANLASLLPSAVRQGGESRRR